MNKDLLKDKKVLIAGGVIILLLVLAAAFYFISAKPGSQQNNQAADNTPTDVPILTLSASDIGLTLTVSPNLQYATMEVTKTSDIASLDYQLSYNATVTGQQVPRGTIGHVDIKTPGQTVSQKMVFGTCSDVCHYDSGISDIKLILKVTKNDGKIYQVEESVTPTPTP